MTEQRKVFCVGLNKTGTLSLHRAMTLLGFSALHHADRLKKAWNRWQQKGGKLFGELDDYEMLADGPLSRCAVVVALLAAYPAAKFINTTRNEETWIDSRIVHVLQNRLFSYKHGWTEINMAAWRKEWHAHKECMEQWEHDPRFLHWALTADPRWEPLCEFLDVPVPGTHRFPHMHTFEQKLERIRALYLAKKKGAAV